MKLLELITRYPGAIPSILNNDPNQALTVKERERLLPSLLSLLLSFVRISRRTRASDKLRPFAREEESLSRSAGSKINDSESSARPIDPDPSIGRCLIDDSVTHLAGFPGSRAAAVALPLWYSTNRFYSFGVCYAAWT